MQLQINNIDDIIELVKTDQIPNDLFCSIVEQAFNCLCHPQLDKQAKIQSLEYWRDVIMMQPKTFEKPLFFEMDIDVEIFDHPRVKEIINKLETLY
jgi:hypothetical protein